MTLWRHTAAGWAEGATVNASSGTGSGDQFTRVVRGTGSTITALAAAARGGASKGLRMYGTGTEHASAGWDVATVVDAISMSCLLGTDTIPSTDFRRLIQPYGGAGSSSTPRIVAMANGSLALLDAAAVTLSTTAVQTLAQWQSGFEIRLHAARAAVSPTTTNGTIQATIKRLSDNVTIMNYSTTTGNARVDGFQDGEFGRVPGTVSWTGYVDVSYPTIATGADATGLIDPKPAVTATGVFYSANGSTLTPATLYYSANGTTLTPVSIG